MTTEEAGYFSVKRYYDHMTYLSHDISSGPETAIASFVTALQRYKEHHPEAQAALLRYLQRVLVRGIGTWNGEETPTRATPFDPGELRSVLVFRLYGLCNVVHGVERRGRLLLAELQGLPFLRIPGGPSSASHNPRGPPSPPDPRPVHRPSTASTVPPSPGGPLLWSGGGGGRSRPSTRRRTVFPVYPDYRDQVPPPPKKGYSFKRLKLEQENLNNMVADWNRYISNENWSHYMTPVQMGESAESPPAAPWPSVERLGLDAIGPRRTLRAVNRHIPRAMVPLYRVWEIAQKIQQWLRLNGLYAQNIRIPRPQSHMKDVFRHARKALRFYMGPSQYHPPRCMRLLALPRRCPPLRRDCPSLGGPTTGRPPSTRKGSLGRRESGRAPLFIRRRQPR